VCLGRFRQRLTIVVVIIIAAAAAAAAGSTLLLELAPTLHHSRQAGREGAELLGFEGVGGALEVCGWIDRCGGSFAKISNRRGGGYCTSPG
jgi:hypothetical protein